MKRLFFICWICCCGLAAFAQRPKVSATVSKAEILIGEPFQLTLQAQLPASKSVAWFAFDSLPHFEILERSTLDSQVNGNTKTLVQNFQITSWDSGRWNLPAFALPQSVRTKPVVIAVSYLPMEAGKKYNDVKDILEVRKEKGATWWWYLVGLALLGLLLLLLFPGRKKRGEVKVAEGAYKEALKSLDALEKRSAKVDAKTFYTDLILVFRQYLLQRKGYASTSKTTNDIVAQLPQWKLTGDGAAKLADVLRLSDGVKFARFEPPATERKTSLAVMRKSLEILEED